MSISGLDNHIAILLVVGHCQNHLGHFEIFRLNFDAIYHSARDMSTSGLGGHIATSGCRSLSHSSRGTLVLLISVENPRFAVGISTLSTLVPEV